MSNQRKFCPSCGAPNDINSAHCVNCGAALPMQGYQQPQQYNQPPPPPQQYNQPPPQYNQPATSYAPPVQSVSILWYVVAIIFGLIGGIVGWYVNRKKNPGAARNILIVSVVSWVIQYYLFVGGY
jgi:hypothetical protein